jgi:tryptophan synthase beta chain
MHATDQEAIDAAMELSKTEGIIPALETAHAFAILPKRTWNQTDQIIICLSGRGDKDLATYMNYVI